MVLHLIFSFSFAAQWDNLASLKRKRKLFETASETIPALNSSETFSSSLQIFVCRVYAS